jgi:hypothetical protein
MVFSNLVYGDCFGCEGAMMKMSPSGTVSISLPTSESRGPGSLQPEIENSFSFLSSTSSSFHGSHTVESTIVRLMSYLIP